MEILINNKLAALKQNTSFEYISENRLFSGSDDYTLNITFPLKDCAQNLAIFGNIHRADIDKSKVRFDCEIRDRNFVKFGTITITEISDTEVKTQFLEGRSEQNFDDTFDDIYINELDLGSPSVVLASSTTPAAVWKVNDEAVALPWINDSTGLMQNKVDYSNSGYSWNEDCSQLSYQPYLLFIAKKICDAVGYTYDFKAWEGSNFRYLLCCNALPAAWCIPQYARALPHWTVAEFFEKLELLMQCEFDIDHRGKEVKFSFSKDVIDAVQPVQITQVIDEYSAEVSAADDTDCDYIGAKNIVFKEMDNDTFKFYSCDWYIRNMRNTKGAMLLECDTVDEVMTRLQRYKVTQSLTGRSTPAQYLYYAKDVDTYFALRAIRRKEVNSWTSAFGTVHYTYEYTCILQPINQFGGHIVDESDDADETEVEFVPVRLDDTDETYGRCMFLETSSYSEDDSTDTEDDAIAQPYPISNIVAGEKDKKSEYFSVIYVGFFNGIIPNVGKVPYPILDTVEITDAWQLQRYDFSIRLSKLFDVASGSAPYRYNIDPTQKYTFSFLADKLPNVRAVFYINGKRYICAKLTATFTENLGMSQLIKGEFYKVTD
jgi:hypothetical protein